MWLIEYSTERHEERLRHALSRRELGALEPERRSGRRPASWLSRLVRGAAAAVGARWARA